MVRVALLLVLAALALSLVLATPHKNYDLHKKDADLFKEWLSDHPGRYGHMSHEGVAGILPFY